MPLRELHQIPDDIRSWNQYLRTVPVQPDPNSVGATELQNDGVTNTKLRDSVGLSVIGRSTNSSGDPADIVAGVNNRFLARKADALSFTQVLSTDVQWPQTAAELSATITPVDYSYEPGRSQRNGLGDGVTDADTAFADLFSGAYADVKIQTGTYAVDGLTIDIHAGIISGSGIETRITATAAHTLTLPADKQDSHLRDIWVDQLAASGNFDAIHALGGEWHLSDIDIDFAPRYGIYVGAYRTQVEKVQSQAVLGTAIYVLNTAYRCQFNQLIFEDAGTDPGNGIDLNSEHCNVTDISSFQQAGWTVQCSGLYHTVQGVTAHTPGGATANNFVNLSGTWNAFSNLIGRGVTGIALNLTGGSNMVHGLITNNTSEEALVVSGNNNYVTGRLFNAGAGGADDIVLVSGNFNRIDLDTSTHTGTYDINVTGADNEVFGVCAGAVRLTGTRNSFRGSCRNISVAGDPTGSTAGFASLDVRVTGAQALGADIQGNSAGGRICCTGAGAAGVKITGNNCTLQLRVFGTDAAGTGIEVDGTRNVLSCAVSGTGAGGTDLLIDGNRNHITGTFEGDVVVNGDLNVIDAHITGNLTINSGADSNRISGIVEGTLTNSVASTRLDLILQNSATYDPGSLADGAGVTTTVTVTGAVLGDFAEASFSNDLQGITMTAYVSAANTVSVRFQNESGGVLDLASGTLRARVKRVA